MTLPRGFSSEIYGGLEIAMNDALFMRSLEPFANLLCDDETFIDGERTSPQLFGKSLSFYQLEDEKPRAIPFLEIIDASDIRMVESGKRLGLPLES